MSVDSSYVPAPRANSNPRYLEILSNEWYRDLVVLQDALTRATYAFFASRGLRTLHLPITTQSISSPMGLGSDSSPVSVNMFGVETYLADSMQFMLEYGCRLHEAGCYYLMPSFRGEPADETHLCQFYHSEAEIPGGLDDVMSLVEGYVSSLTQAMLTECGEILGRHGAKLDVLRRVAGLDRFPRVRASEALRILKDEPGCTRPHPAGFQTITRAGERRLMDHFGGIVWLTHPPHIAVPFYQAFADSEGREALAADLLFGLGEVVGCGERHATGHGVRQALERHAVEPQPYQWYIGLKDEKPLRTSGFGLGTERYLCWLLDHRDIRDCQILPRYNGVVTIP